MKLKSILNNLSARSNAELRLSILNGEYRGEHEVTPEQRARVNDWSAHPVLNYEVGLITVNDNVMTVEAFE